MILICNLKLIKILSYLKE